MVLAGLQFEKIDDVDEANLYIWELLTQERRRGQRFQGRNVASGGDHHVGLNALVVASPVPDPYALGTVLNRCVHVEVLKVKLLVRDDDIDIVFTSEAVVRY